MTIDERCREPGIAPGRVIDTFQFEAVDPGLGEVLILKQIGIPGPNGQPLPGANGDSVTPSI
ncbi:hypothetical protein [Mesorhizobium sp. B4-1-4]|uniref:hypothetical protein n=1 Tax=Mesorhizobium sp. B4-1-4 TaxID=2589888 RepID=UPI0039AFF5A6